MASLRTSRALIETYPSVTRPNQRLNPRPSRPSTPFGSRRGLSKSALNAGLKVRALKAEMSTETAMVKANC